MQGDFHTSSSASYQINDQAQQTIRLFSPPKTVLNDKSTDSSKPT